jgi:hypothetical protein
MTDLETKLAEAERLIEGVPSHLVGFDTAAAIAREVVAEKDAEIARLEAERGASFKANGELSLELEARRLRIGSLERQMSLRKVTDAQREAMVETLLNNNVENEKWARKMVEQCCRVLESKVGNATKTI